MLQDYLRKNGIELTPGQYSALDSHLHFVIERNKLVRLTAIADYETGVRLHVYDSLAILPQINSCPDGPLLDMGTGGGFPGLPLGIVTGRDVTLLDSVKKKCLALDEFIQSSNPSLPNIRTASVRAEELALVNPEYYSCITARALSALPSLVELASPLLVLGGRLVAMKGNPIKEELAAGDSVALYVGMKRVATHSYQLPDGGDKRTLVIYEKVGRSKTKLPRRPGMAQKNPFA